MRYSIQHGYGQFTATNVTYNDASNALGRVAALLQMLGHNGKNTGREGHVENAVCLGSAGFQLLEVLVELVEGLILVVLAGDVGAQIAEIGKLLFDLGSGCLNVGLDPPQVLVMVHLGTGISNNLDIFGEELVTVL